MRSDIDPEALRTLVEKATKGEVLLETVKDENDRPITYIVHPVTTICDKTAICEVIDLDYGPLIVAAVNALPHLLDERAADKAEIERLRGALGPFAEISKRKVNLYLSPDDPIVLRAKRALRSSVGEG